MSSKYPTTRPGLDSSVLKMMEEWIHGDTTPPPPPPKPSSMGWRRDPMSPYDMPYTPDHYTDLSDIMNNRPFLAVYPQSYTPVSKFFVEPISEDHPETAGRAPFFEPHEGEDYARGALTIAGMVELNANHIAWELVRDQDLEEVEAIASAYYEELKTLGDKNDLSIKAYLQRLANFLNVMQDGIARMKRRTGQQAPNNSIASLARRAAQ